MKLNSFVLAALIVVLLFGGIGVSTALNWWQTESSKTPAKFADGEYSGQYNPADIRGSYTFGDVSELFEIPLSDLAAAFRVPVDSDPASFTVKDLEALSVNLPVEVGTASVRMFVAFYTGLPYDLSTAEETYLFPEAAAILKAQNKMLPEQVAYLESHLVPIDEELNATSPTPADTQGTPPSTEVGQADRTITGKTTFQNLLDWGVSQEAIEKIIGETMPAPQVIVKDYATQKGVEFSTIKTQLQAEVDKSE